MSIRARLVAVAGFVLPFAIDGSALAGFDCAPTARSYDYVMREVEDGELKAAYLTPRAKGRRPGLLILGGSEGGARVVRGLAGPFAENGYASLALSYFGMEGLPENLEEIPLEYFTRALDWLAAQPEVDPHRLGVYGISKGAEAALLFSSRDARIKAVAVGAPSHAVWQNINRTDFTPRSSWTENGAPLPFVPYDFSNGFVSIFALYDGALVDMAQHEDAVIPVENINGAVLLISGEKDTIWPSSKMADLIIERFEREGFAHEKRHLRYEDAGHAAAVPPALGALGGPDSFVGGSEKGNAAARDDMWRNMQCFLRANLEIAQ